MTNLLLILLLLVGCSEDAPIETNEESYSFLGDWEIIEFSIWSQNDYSDQACSESYDLSNEFVYYICGNGNMISEVYDHIISNSIESKNIFMESFFQ